MRVDRGGANDATESGWWLGRGECDECVYASANASASKSARLPVCVCAPCSLCGIYFVWSVCCGMGCVQCRVCNERREDGRLPRTAGRALKPSKGSRRGEGTAHGARRVLQLANVASGGQVRLVKSRAPKPTGCDEGVSAASRVLESVGCRGYAMDGRE